MLRATRNRRRLYRVVMARTAASSRARARATNSSSVWTSALVCWTGVKAIGNVLGYCALDAGQNKRFPAHASNASTAIRDCCRNEMSALAVKSGQTVAGQSRPLSAVTQSPLPVRESGASQLIAAATNPTHASVIAADNCYPAAFFVAFSPLAAFTAAHAVTVPISISITRNFNSYLSLGIKTVGGQLLGTKVSFGADRLGRKW